VGREVAQQDSEETRANTRPLAIVGMDEAVDRIARKGARERASARLDILVAQDSNDRRLARRLRARGARPRPRSAAD
jgi:hypothetical protein